MPLVWQNGSYFPHSPVRLLSISVPYWHQICLSHERMDHVTVHIPPKGDVPPCSLANVLLSVLPHRDVPPCSSALHMAASRGNEEAIIALVGQFVSQPRTMPWGRHALLPNLSFLLGVPEKG